MPTTAWYSPPIGEGAQCQRGGGALNGNEGLGAALNTNEGRGCSVPTVRLFNVNEGRCSMPTREGSQYQREVLNERSGVLNANKAGTQYQRGVV